MGAVTDQKANTTLTVLSLGVNMSGSRRRHSTRRRLEGNGFDVFTMSVQGMCLLLPNISLHTEV